MLRECQRRIDITEESTDSKAKAKSGTLDLTTSELKGRMGILVLRAGRYAWCPMPRAADSCDQLMRVIEAL